MRPSPARPRRRCVRPRTRWGGSMDGEIEALTSPGSAVEIAHGRGEIARPAAVRTRTVRWTVIVGLLLGLVLGALYGFNRYPEQAIANFFANNKPPPAQIAAGAATNEGEAALAPRDRPVPS